MSSLNAFADEFSMRLPILIDLLSEICGQTDANKIRDIFLEGVLSVTDSRRARLIRKEQEAFFVRNEAVLVEDQIVVHSNCAPLPQKCRLNLALAELFHANTPTLLDDEFRVVASGGDERPEASTSGPILCLPFLTRDRVSEVLYLEKTDLTDVFSPASLDFVRLLTAQTIGALKSIELREQVAAESQRRELAENALVMSESALAEAQRISRTGSWRWSVKTRRTQASTEFLRIHELDHTDALSYERLVDRIHPDDRPSFEQQLAEAVEKRSIFKCEYRIVVPSGLIKYLHVEGHPDAAVSGDLEYVGVVIDVTERRRDAEALQAAQAELARSLRFATMGELAASIVHEVNQPLTAVVANSETCLRWLSRSTPDLEQARQAAMRTTRDAERVANVIKGLRSIAWKTAFAKVPVDIDDAIKEISLLLRSDIERHHIGLSLHLNAGRPVRGDRVQLQQVLINLMRNSIEAMMPLVDGPRHLVVSSAMHTEGMVSIKVHDNGVGLTVDMMQSIYDATFTTKVHGMGMGLSISRSIVEAHGGKLTVSSSPADGTIFQFAIPYFVA
jgi:signal transduction histidine kinase